MCPDQELRKTHEFSPEFEETQTVPGLGFAEATLDKRKAFPPLHHSMTRRYVEKGSKVLPTCPLVNKVLPYPRKKLRAAVFLDFLLAVSQLVFCANLRHAFASQSPL